MRIYIAYKYTNSKNKEGLINILENLATSIESFGHEAFLLGRDVKKWEYMHISILRLIPIIFSNIKKSDLIAVYFDSNTFSKGLLYELIICKILSKNALCFNLNNSDLTFYKPLFTKIINIQNISEIKKEDFEIK